MLDWLMSSIDPSRAHEVGFHVSWHGRAMVLAWGVLVPIGVIAARYFKILPRQAWPAEVDNRVWWNTHRACQYTATVLTLGAIALVRAGDQEVGDSLHYLFGYAVLTFVAMQVIGGLLRGTKGGPTDGSLAGDHYDMTPRRIAFEYVHKVAGYTAILLAVTAICSGMWLANAPKWMWIGLALWWAFLAACVVLLQRRGMCVDTYQALWGPDPAHPGNQRPHPIGFQVRRLPGPDDPGSA
ncbi:cytochrome b561 domain-containing protein [Actibacterium sp. 188UL27-1]|uniref:cytochrome b561 domain-containing protein n=1 Tax=Actibacterium sp. 188UL27-1 TaxID=2786961 RepID=UPI001956FE9D|nr:cytochrome b561 domain-containing protein [Actibacterium sp. 188UL27-1]MBM7066121.1 cytochrome B [Actibacterium sp. 188UL27-1]